MFTAASLRLALVATCASVALAACSSERPEVVATTDHLYKGSGTSYNAMSDFMHRNATTMDECWEERSDLIGIMAPDGKVHRYVGVARFRSDGADIEGEPDIAEVRRWFEDLGGQCQEGAGPYALHCSYRGGPIFKTDEWNSTAVGSQTYEFVGALAFDDQPYSHRWGKSVLAYRLMEEWENETRMAEDQCKSLGLDDCEVLTWPRASLTFDQCSLDKTPLFRVIEVGPEEDDSREGRKAFYDERDPNAVPIEKAATPDAEPDEPKPDTEAVMVEEGADAVEAEVEAEPVAE